MDTIAPSSTCRHTRFQIATARPTDFIDITEPVEVLVKATGVGTGLINIQSLHTTAAIAVNEDEPLLRADFDALLERTAPVGASYRHDDVGLRAMNRVLGERPNGHSHCRALLMNASVCLNVVDGRLQLGRWQRVFLVELDGPRTRELSLLIVGDGGR